MNVQGEGELPPPPQVMVDVGPTIRVLVGKSPVPTDDEEDIEFVGQEAHALIDTGASTSCIEDNYAQELGLIPIDRQEIGGVSGKKEHVVYLGMVAVPDLGTHSNGRFIGIELNPPHTVILGRDFLHGSFLIYNGAGGRLTILR